MNCPKCHKPFIPDMPGMNPKGIAMYEGEEFIVHEHCATEIVTDIQTQKSKKAQKKVIFDWLKKLSAAIFILFAINLNADEMLDQKDWKKGAVVTYIKADGGCIFKPFIQVGISEDWDGVSQVLGVTPGDVQKSQDGSVILERVAEAYFIQLGHAKVIRGRMCKCPPYQF